MISSVGSSILSATASDTAAQNASRAKQQAAARQAADDQKVQASKTALITLTAQTKAKTDPQKAAQAKAKLDGLRKQLQALMMMGGDPKRVAKQAAQLLKQIGQAAKDYADATGDGSAGGAAPATPAAPAAPADGSQSADGQSADAQPGTEGSDAQSADGQGAAASGQAQGPQTQDPQAQNAQAPNAQAQDPQAQLVARAKALAQTVVTSFSGPAVAAKMKKSDDVLDGAKSMAASAKALIKAAEARAKQQDKNSPEFGDARSAADQTDKDLAQATKTLGIDDPLSGYTASGSSAPAAEAEPVISVQT